MSHVARLMGEIGSRYSMCRDIGSLGIGPKPWGIVMISCNTPTFGPTLPTSVLLGGGIGKFPYTRTQSGYRGPYTTYPRHQCMALSSINYPQLDKRSSFGPSLPAFALPNRKREAQKLRASVRDQWAQALCAKPQATWLRHLGTICNQAPCTLRAQLSCSLSHVPSSKPLRMPIQHLSDNKP